MLTLLALLGSAYAADACAEVQNMMSIGLPEDAIVEAIGQMNVAPSDVACLEDAGVAEEVLKAARAAEVEEVVPPEPEAEEPVQVESAAASAEPSAVPESYMPQAYRPRPPSPGCSDAYLMATLPDPGAAAALSGFVGFGAGSFYAKRPFNGVLAMAPQVIGLGLVGVGLAQLGSADPDAARGLYSAGSALFTVGRMADVALATGAAHSARLEAVEACGY